MEENDGLTSAKFTPCVACASSWKPTRRELVQAAVVATAVATLALSGPASHASNIPPYGDTSCEGRLARCLSGAKSPELSDFQKTLARILCQAQYAECKAAEGGAAIAVAIGKGIDWLDKHPEVVLGTIVVIGGIALIAVTGPAGALVLIAL